MDTKVDERVSGDWFDKAIRYMRGDPSLTSCDFSEGVYADFLEFWDAQDVHFRRCVRYVFLAAPNFVEAAALSREGERRK